MKKYIALFLVLLMTGVSQAGENNKSDNALGLSAATSTLLKQEMNEIKKGMESLVFSIASGDWEKIAETGHQIKHSYIMKNKLTESQRHELHEKLPKQFREIDKKFHYYAGMLSHVAKERDSELVNYYFYKMNESCSSCHSQFVSNRFEGFRQGNKHEQHDH
ncbi:MAG: hypothetical protein OEX83_07615 [Gammaproteobacteria bacterium]|nr:hypothetical protein [Gammaproteobacteria bacterium]